jgi:hypothetical protein
MEQQEQGKVKSSYQLSFRPNSKVTFSWWPIEVIGPEDHASVLARTPQSQSSCTELLKSWYYSRGIHELQLVTVADITHNAERQIIEQDPQPVQY